MIGSGQTMKAAWHDRYGPPTVLRLRSLERPSIGPDGVLVRVRASSVNALDWHMLRAEPYMVRLVAGLRGPKQKIRGVDVAGVVEAVGETVSEFVPGDEVFGAHDGAFAEFVAGTTSNFASKPARLTFEQAAAIPVAGCTALQALRDQGRLEHGQHVLVNGATGSVGSFVVQVAKAFGAEVTAVCSTRNVELVRSIGADHVIDYTAHDFLATGVKYDLALSIAGSRSIRDLARAVKPTGTVVFVGSGAGRHGGGGLIGPLAEILKLAVLNRVVKPRLRSFIAAVRKDDLRTLAALAEAGKITPLIDRSYPLSGVADAIAYVEEGHARGKVVITIGGQ